MLAFMLVSFGFAATTYAQEYNEPKILSKLQLEQKYFISSFSGALPYEGNAILSSRSTQKQRAIAADYLVKTLGQMGLPVKRHSYQYPNMHFLLDLVMPPYKGQNIVSHIPATASSDRYIVIGAHYDSVIKSPGANDNASGVAVALSIGQAIMRLKDRNAHFLIVFFDHEEDGSSGSKAYVRKLLRDNIAVHSMHNIDMIGWDSDHDRTMEIDLPTDKMENIYRSAAQARNVEITRVSYNSADHLSFRNAGIDAVCISEEYGSGDSTPHYHKPTDTIDGVDFGYLESTTLVLIDVMTTLARQP
jgi:Zn-dependent M28 family amino/carboxypeptidase